MCIDEPRSKCLRIRNSTTERSQVRIVIDADYESVIFVQFYARRVHTRVVVFQEFSPNCGHRLHLPGSEVFLFPYCRREQPYGATKNTGRDQAGDEEVVLVLHVAVGRLVKNEGEGCLFTNCATITLAVTSDTLVVGFLWRAHVLKGTWTLACPRR